MFEKLQITRAAAERSAPGSVRREGTELCVSLPEVDTPVHRKCASRYHSLGMRLAVDYARFISLTVGIMKVYDEWAI